MDKCRWATLGEDNLNHSSTVTGSELALTAPKETHTFQTQPWKLPAPYTAPVRTGQRLHQRAMQGCNSTEHHTTVMLTAFPTLVINRPGALGLTKIRVDISCPQCLLGEGGSPVHELHGPCSAVERKAVQLLDISTDFMLPFTPTSSLPSVLLFHSSNKGAVCEPATQPESQRFGAGCVLCSHGYDFVPVPSLIKGRNVVEILREKSTSWSWWTSSSVPHLAARGLLDLPKRTGLCASGEKQPHAPPWGAGAKPSSFPLPTSVLSTPAPATSSTAAMPCFPLPICDGQYAKPQNWRSWKKMIWSIYLLAAPGLEPPWFCCRRGAGPWGSRSIAGERGRHQRLPGQQQQQWHKHPPAIKLPQVWVWPNTQGTSVRDCAVQKK